MTDNEIIKALECCAIKDCGNCPVNHIGFCVDDAMKEALDLINRQKAEVEDMKETITLQAETLGTQNKMWKTARNDGIKLFAEVLKEKTAYFYSAFGVRHEIDNLVKEMVGADND